MEKECERILLTIDRAALNRYAKYYFSMHKRAKVYPIQNPYHESINVWMIMRRQAMNALKGKWKAFMKWLVDEQGYSNLCIDNCQIVQRTFYSNNRRHDVDNSVPKFIIDGLVESGMIVDDDFKHITRLTMECGVDLKNPRTELEILVYGYAPQEIKEENEEEITNELTEE